MLEKISSFFKNKMDSEVNSYLEKFDFTGKSIEFSGWVFSNNQIVEELFIKINSKKATDIFINKDLPRKDVANKYKTSKNALNSGFIGIVNLNEYEGLLKVSLWVKLKNGLEKKIYEKSFSTSIAKKNKIYSLAYLIFKEIKTKSVKQIFSSNPNKWLNKLKKIYFLTYQDQDAFTSINSHVIDSYQKWIFTNSITNKLEQFLKLESIKLNRTAIKISIVVPIFNVKRNYLEDLISSINNQYYENWELLLVDDASTKTYIKEILNAASAKDRRIKVVFNHKNLHISESTNIGIRIATGKFIAFVDHDDLLPKDSLLHVARCINQNPWVDYIYTDEDKIDDVGNRFDPQFKSAWNPEMAMTHNYTHHLSVIRKSLITKSGMFRRGYEGAQDLDLFFRVFELTSPKKIIHLPYICYHWRTHINSTASLGNQKSYIFQAAKKSIEDSLGRRKIKAKVYLPDLFKKNGMCLYQLNWENNSIPRNMITIIIPCRDKIDLLKNCLASLKKTINLKVADIIIIDDESQENNTFKYYSEIRKETHFKIKIIKSKRLNKDKFNYSRLINSAVRHVKTPYFLQLNNDVRAIHKGWLENMYGLINISGVGVVGAKLTYKKNTIQHAGVYINENRLPDHQFLNHDASEIGYLGLAHITRNVSAVTGACMLTKTSLFKNILGYNENFFDIEYGDIDYCLKVINKHLRVVFCGNAELFHITSASRGFEYDSKSHLAFYKKYNRYEDNYVNKNLLSASGYPNINPDNFIYSSFISELNIIAFTHDLSLTGAPITFFEYLKSLKVKAKFNINLISFADGPLKKSYEKIGITPIISSKFELKHLFSSQYNADINKYCEFLINKFKKGNDLVICNTYLTHPAIIAAKALKIPTLWQIHESSGIQNMALISDNPNLYQLQLIEAFKSADLALFQSNETRKLYENYSVNNFYTLSGGVPVDDIKKYMTRTSKVSIRKKNNLDKNTIVVSLIGTTCERKGQLVFLEAIDIINKLKISSRIVFNLVGAIESPYLEKIKETIKKKNINNVRVIYETPNIYEYYRVTDILVCASFEESFPMNILLAMTFKIPIITTDAFGIKEMVRDNETCSMYPVGNYRSLADNIINMIENKTYAKYLVNNAYANLVIRYNNENQMKKYIEIIKNISVKEVS